MKFYTNILIIFVIGFSVGESGFNRNFTRSRYSLRNRDASLRETTTLLPDETTGKPMEIVVESQTINVGKPMSKKIERDALPSLADPGQILMCGNRTNGDSPWIAVIEHRDPTGRDKRTTLSKGVLISRRHVLTTVSSIHNTHPFWIATQVRLGDPSTWINKNIVRDRSNIASVEIEKVYQHSSKDIAVIRLKDSVQYGDYIQPACLPINDNYNFPELYQHICKRHRSQSTLHKLHIELASVKPLSPQDCSTMFHRRGASFSDGQMCAWDEYGDTCTGDIGGPLLAKFYGKYMVVGLNSYVLTNKEFDATDYPGVYVNVGYFIKWINDVIIMKD